MKRLLSLLVTVLLTCSLIFSGCGAKDKPDEKGSEGKKKVKVALLLPGTINDNGWNATAYNGLKLMEKELGAEIAYSEKVAQSDQEEIMRNYVIQGFNVVIGHGFEFGDAAKRVAKENQEVKFLVTSSNISQEPNLSSIDTNPKQMGFLEGVVAAMYSKSNIIGAVGGLEIPPITGAIAGFEAGVKYMNPSAQVLISMTGDFDDAVKAKEATKALIAKGADVVMLDADQAGLGVIEACQEKGIYAVSSISSQHELAPDTVLGSGISDYPKAMELVVKYIIDGTFKAQFYDLGTKEEVVYLVPNPKFESVYKEKLAEVKADINSGKIDVESLIKNK